MQVATAFKGKDFKNIFEHLDKQESKFKLIIVDNICSPLMPFTSFAGDGKNMREGFSIANQVTHSLHKLARQGAAVLCVNNAKVMKDQDIVTIKPALGSMWEGLAHESFLLEQVSKDERKVTTMNSRSVECVVRLHAGGLR